MKRKDFILDTSVKIYLTVRTIKATDAVAEAVKLADIMDSCFEDYQERKVEKEVKDTSLSDCLLHGRAVALLRNAGIITIGDVCNHTRDEIRSIRGFGAHFINDLRELLETYGLTFKKDEYTGIRK